MGITVPPIQLELAKDPGYPAGEKCTVHLENSNQDRVFSHLLSNGAQGHYLCAQCVHDWFFTKGHNTCPTCREPIDMAQLKDTFQELPYTTRAKMTLKNVIRIDSPRSLAAHLIRGSGFLIYLAALTTLLTSPSGERRLILSGTVALLNHCLFEAVHESIANYRTYIVFPYVATHILQRAILYPEVGLLSLPRQASMVAAVHFGYLGLIHAVRRQLETPSSLSFSRRVFSQEHIQTTFLYGFLGGLLLRQFSSGIAIAPTIVDLGAGALATAGYFGTQLAIEATNKAINTGKRFLLST